MESASTDAKDRSGSVRTLEPGSCYPPGGCPVCGKALTGRQTVCSGRCRARRWRHRQATRPTVQNPEEEMLLRVVIGVLTDRLNKVVERRRE